MTDSLRIACAQLNPVVGDVNGNAALARSAREEAARQNAELVVFPELFIAGYPPEDLILKPAFVEACKDAIDASRGSPQMAAPRSLDRNALA